MATRDIKVLASSVGSLKEKGYARAYHLLENFPTNAGITIDPVIVGEDHDITNPVVHPHPANGPNRLLGKLNHIRHTKNLLNTNEYDVYHRVRTMYGSFNPLLQQGPINTPTLIGPLEPHHDFQYNQFKRLVFEEWLNFVPPDLVSKGLYKLLMQSQSIIDTVRLPMFRRTLQNADKIIVVNKATKDFYLGDFIQNEDKIEVVTYGTRLNRFKPREEKTPKTLLYVGRLTKRKHPLDLLTALKDVIKTHPGAHLHIVGHGPKEDELREKAHALDIEKNITIHGFVSEDKLKELYETSAIFVHPSHSEGFSHTRLEAMSAGLPVIGTGLVATEGIPKNNKTGYVYSPGDTKKLSQYIIKLLDNPTLARRMGKNSREYVEENHNWKQISKQYAQIYKSLAKNKN